MTKFHVLAEMLRAAFNSSCVSEDNYHDIVRCMRQCSPVYRDLDPKEEDDMLRALGVRYNPFEHYENIRFGLVIGAQRSGEIDRLVTLFDSL